jgi:hypothetical protein
MYMSISEMIAMMIVLGVSMFLIIITTVANYILLKENRFLRSRLRAWRTNCSKTHVYKPF